MTAKTLYDKLWDAHLVRVDETGESLLYIDRHLVHEVTSPQAFEGLKQAGRALWRKESVFAVPEHNVPTRNHDQGMMGIEDIVSRKQVAALDENAKQHALHYIPLDDVRQGIAHVIGPEQGAVLPGMTVVCGDSHTSTHGALGCLAHGIGTSEVEHVMATQCLSQKKMKNMLVQVNGKLKSGVCAKDVVLAIIGRIGTAGGTGYAIEFGGEVFQNMSIEGRMTVCNMTIEAGARAGMVAVDDKTIEYVLNRPLSPKSDQWEKAVSYWKTFYSDVDATFDRVEVFDGSGIRPQVSWGTSPEMVVSIDEPVPNSSQPAGHTQAEDIKKALSYMGLKGGESLSDIPIDYVFIGSCTNSRIEDLRLAAGYLENKTISSCVERAMVVPGSGLIRQQAEDEGLDQIFKQAGFEWREAGCSMCLGMNEDQLPEGKHCASTSNRNFEGRQGKGGRTHLVSPLMAAAAAVNGRFVDVSAQ